MRFTAAQDRAIRLSGLAPILVSAAAGAGKTTVLTERIFRRLAGGKVAPSEILVLTFTERAAAEMKHRIVRRFDDAVKKSSGKERERLEAVSASLPEASISTIHAFCNSLVREFSADLKDDRGEPLLEPGWLVLAPEMADRLLRQAAEDVLKAFYRLESRRRREGDEAFNQIVSRKLPVTSTDILPFSLLDDVAEHVWLDRFLLTVRALSRGYGDDALKELIFSIHAALRSLPDYEKLLREKLLDLRENSRFFAPDKAKERMKRLKEDVSSALNAFAQLKTDPYYQRAFDPKEKAKTITAMADPLQKQEELLGEIASLFERPDAPKWDEIVAVARKFPGMKLPAMSARGADFFMLYGGSILPLVEQLSGTILSQAALLRHAPDVLPVYTRTKAEIEADEKATEEILAGFAELTLLIDMRYRTLKVRQNAVDFSDFEHDALSLLRCPEIAETMNLRIREIYVDEYQDTSSIQDAILEQISKGGRFMVGDVKQSIYRFRHANPALFMSKSERYQVVTTLDEAADEAAEGGRLILLNENFRSRKRILAFVNRLFSRIMEDTTGDIVYDDRHRLVPGRCDADGDPPVQIFYVRATAPDRELPEGDEEQPEQKGFTVPPAETTLYEETTITVNEIVRLLEAGHKPEDIAILGRTSAICGAYYRALRLCNIPVSGVSQEYYRDSAEYRTLVAIAAVTVNRRHDIELASLMLSDFLPEPFNENELLDLRLFAGRDMSFSEAVEHYAEAGEDTALKNKVADFLNTLERQADLAAELSVVDWFRAVLHESGYEDTVSRGADGRQRLGNVRMFLNDLKETSPKDLREFLSMQTEKLTRLGGVKSYTERTILPGTVQILTMHAAKGLEFPVVFVVGLGSSWRPAESTPLSFSEESGLCSDTFEAQTLLRRTNEHHRDVLDTLASANCQEEWRLLYVALTRAEEKLYLVIREPYRKGALDLSEQTYSLICDERLNFPEILRCKTAGRLIFAALALDDPEALNCFFECVRDEEDEGKEDKGHEEGERRKNDEGAPAIIESGDVVFCIKQPGTVWPQPDVKAKLEETKTGGLRSVANIIHLLSAKTPYREAADATAKLTVSEMKRRVDADLLKDDGIEKEAALIRDLAYTVDRPDRPGKHAARELGTILHTVFQFLEPEVLRKNPCAETYERMLQDMVDKQRLLPDEAKLAKPFAKEALQFALSDLGALISDPETKVYREMPFTLSLPIPELPGEITLIQGIIDLWFVTAKGDVFLVDFKSDVTGERGEETIRTLMQRRYGVQLSLYARAIEKAVSKQVKYSMVWLIRNGFAIDISTESAEGDDR